MARWGGRRGTVPSLCMTGLRGQIFSRPYGSGKRGGNVHSFISCASGESPVCCDQSMRMDNGATSASFVIQAGWSCQSMTAA